MSEQTNPEALWNRTPYRQRDRHLIDYQTYQLDGAREEFRGPPVTGDAYVACVGASQTFGRFVQAPFPNLIARALGIEVLNLGRGGAGPTFPLGNPLLLERINHARAAVVQVFSAADFYTALLQEDEQLARQIVAETRANYVQSMTELLDAITVPKVLFWFSVRAPEYREQWRLPIHRLFGDFPQLVNREMVDQLRSHSDRYVECVSRRGLPQPLPGPILSGAPGTPPLPPGAEAKTENRYYPSPEMHEEAAALLIPEVRALLDRR